jgi:hypothetical protein
MMSRSSGGSGEKLSAFLGTSGTECNAPEGMNTGCSRLKKSKRYQRRTTWKECERLTARAFKALEDPDMLLAVYVDECEVR